MELREKIVELMRELFLAYDPSPGDFETTADAILAIPELRDALAEKLRREAGIVPIYEPKA